VDVKRVAALRVDVDKVKAINNAKDEYNDKVSQLHKDVIDARFELSRDIISRSDQLRKEAEAKTLQEREIEREDIQFAREDLALLSQNYALEDFAGLPDDVKQKFDELEKASDLPPGFTEVAIENFKKQNGPKAEDLQIRFEKDDEGNVTIIGVDKYTGQVMATSQVMGAGTTAKQSGSKEPTNEMEKAFKVGTVGGWCGDFASRVSTAAKVGNTWAEKVNKVTHRDNPQPGDKVAIPLGVTDSSKDYGHMMTILSSNPETGEILVIQSNADGRQTRGEGQGIITLGRYNVNDLKAQYGENWGFIDGELKPEWKKIAMQQGLLDIEEEEEKTTSTSTSTKKLSF